MVKPGVWLYLSLLLRLIANGCFADVCSSSCGWGREVILSSRLLVGLTKKTAWKHVILRVGGIRDAMLRYAVGAMRRGR